jgi:hypothetical protein
MKAHYQALATSALLFLSADKGRQAIDVFFGSSVATSIHFVIAGRRKANQITTVKLSAVIGLP